MKTGQFQADRSEALRRQLVEMPVASGNGYRSRRAQANAKKVAQPRKPYRKTRMAFGLAAAGVGLMVAGQLHLTAQSAQAAGVLRSAAESAATFTDLRPDAAQYLLVHTHANWTVFSADGANQEAQVIDLYIPANSNQEWALDRDWGDSETKREVIHSRNGEFYGSPWANIEQRDMEALPRDGKALYDHFNSGYSGGSNSRDEDNFVRMTDLLRTGMVPADLRAGLFEALALIPGVTATKNVANFDGRQGVAIGRTEALRGGERSEIIIDPDTGRIIGERSLLTVAAFGFGINETISHTAIDYRIVDSIPAPQEPASWREKPGH